jgi:hypothetical protein
MMNRLSKIFAVTALPLALATAVPAPLALAEKAIQPETAPPGESKSAKTKMLEAGARLLQSNDPLKRFDIYLVGFHPMKDHPEKQMEAHHYCHQVNEDFAQCALFDGNTRDANLNGIEYIISEKLFATLPEEEKKYWHPQWRNPVRTTDRTQYSRRCRKSTDEGKNEQLW